MTINLDKYIVKDVISILFENKDARITQTYDGFNLDFDALTKEERNYIGRLMYEAYMQGAKRAVDLFNRNEERKAQQAQKRAIDKILKGNYYE